MADMDIGDWLVFDNMGAFAMSQWDNNFSAQNGQNFSQHGALLIAENFWYIPPISILGRIVRAIEILGATQEEVCLKKGIIF
jgi:hypothetical protein